MHCAPAGLATPGLSGPGPLWAQIAAWYALRVRLHRLFIACFAITMAAAGCQCHTSSTSEVTGEVRWEWDIGTGPQHDTSARVNFPVTTMGARREQLLWVSNVGPIPFSMSEFAKLGGSAVVAGALSESAPAFEVQWTADVVVNPTERQPVTVLFTPPVLLLTRIVA